MELAYTLNGNAPLVKKYQVSSSSTAVGQPWMIPAAGGAGVTIATTTSAADMVGVNLDSAVYVTAQQTDGSSAERQVSLIVSPDAVWRMKMTGGATENTALALAVVTTASTDGLVVTTSATDWSTTTKDEGFIWGFDGANAGQSRKITSVSTTSATVTVAFDQDTVVGDNFIGCPFTPMQGTAIQLSTLLTQANATIAVGTGAQFKTIELILNDQTADGRNNSFVLAVSNSHIFNLA